MPLLERISTLLRANVNDLLDKAESPEKLARQLVLDMENQLVQVKTQVAIALADQHLLERKLAEQRTQHAQWLRKAELAVARGQEDMARGALERALTHERMAEQLALQHADQAADAETLRSAYKRLEQKLAETRDRVELLLIAQRRARATGKAAAAQALTSASSAEARVSRLVSQASAGDAAGRALLSVAAPETLDERFDSLERNARIEALLEDLRARQPVLAASPEDTPQLAPAPALRGLQSTE